jgi:ATP-dependent exoDNAse (exonuclease V) alpha subunit
MLWADQIICATNATRLSLNKQMRDLLGYSGLPQDGEKMICLRNYWEDFSEDGDAVLVNGTTGILRNPFETYVMAPSYVKMRNHQMDIICGEFISDENKVFNSVDMDKAMIETGEPCLDWRESYALGKLKNKIGDIVPRQFTYGYAITCHKSQGSEWDKVLVIEEKFPFDKTEHARWLYTAATRSAEKLVLVR